MTALLKTCTHVELQIGAKHMVLVTFLVFTMVLLSNKYHNQGSFS